MLVSVAWPRRHDHSRLHSAAFRRAGRATAGDGARGPCGGWGWGLGRGRGGALRGKDPGPRGPRFPGTYYQRANCKCAACEEQSRNSLEVDTEKRSTMLMKSDHHHARRPVKGRSAARAWACLMRMDLMRPFIRSRAPKTHASLDPPMALDRSKSTLP